MTASPSIVPSHLHGNHHQHAEPTSNAVCVHVYLCFNKVLSKAISASACEFNWSDVSHVVNKRRQRLADSTIDKIVNVRAMSRLEACLTGCVKPGNVPKLDDVLDELVNSAIQAAPGGGDDVADVESADEDEFNSSDDEDLDVMGEDSDDESANELYQLPTNNMGLENSVGCVLGL